MYLSYVGCGWCPHMTSTNATVLENVNLAGHKLITQMINTGRTWTEPGSLKFLLWGRVPSEQSISIKIGKYGEELFKLIIRNLPHLQLLKCGIQIMNGEDKKKDVDLCWVDIHKNTIYVMELKGNMILDTEKLPATFQKMNDVIGPWAVGEYPGYVVNTSILHWGIYDRTHLKKGLAQIKKCEAAGVPVNHVRQFLDLVGFTWSEDEYKKHFSDIGRRFNSELLGQDN
jgi:hypothetical protein